MPSEVEKQELEVAKLENEVLKLEKDNQLHKVRVKQELLEAIRKIDEETKQIEEGGCNIDAKIQVLKIKREELVKRTQEEEFHKTTDKLNKDEKSIDTEIEIEKAN